MANTIQVVCNDTGESADVEPEPIPEAGERRAVCPNGCMCGAAEYREPEAIEA